MLNSTLYKEENRVMKVIKPFINTLMPLLVIASLVVGSTPAAVAISLSPADPPSGSTFDQRLVQRKAEQNEQLDQKTTQHLQQQCQGAQTILRILQNKSVPMLSNRNATYLKIDAILWVNIGQLKLAGQTTFTLEQQHTVLAQKMAGFQNTSTNYLLNLNDILTINCAADVVGFQALLDTARAYYAQLISEEKDIYNYTVNTVKPTLEGFIAPLQPSTNTTGGQ